MSRPGLLSRSSLQFCSLFLNALIWTNKEWPCMSMKAIDYKLHLPYYTFTAYMCCRRKYNLRPPSPPSSYCIQSTLSERVQVTWYPNLQIGIKAFVHCKITTWRTECVSFSRLNETQHSSYELVYFIESRDVPVIRLRYFQVCYKFV